MHNRDRMRYSNRLVRKYLLQKGYDDIWFKPHGKRNDLVFTQRGNYLSQDIWNLFDGICRLGSMIIFLQMSTTLWHTKKQFEDFVKRTNGVGVLVFLVTNKRKGCNGKYKVFERRYGFAK